MKQMWRVCGCQIRMEFGSPIQVDITFPLRNRAVISQWSPLRFMRTSDVLRWAMSPARATHNHVRIMYAWVFPDVAFTADLTSASVAAGSPVGMSWCASLVRCFVASFHSWSSLSLIAGPRSAVYWGRRLSAAAIIPAFDAVVDHVQRLRVLSLSSTSRIARATGQE